MAQGTLRRDSWLCVNTASFLVEGWCRVAPLASIRQMNRQVSRSTHGEYQADEQAGVEWLSWRVSGR